MVSTENQVIGFKAVSCIALGRKGKKKRGPQNEGISQWLTENKGDNFLASATFAPIPKC
jgi:hypothetical protein